MAVLSMVFILALSLISHVVLGANPISIRALEIKNLSPQDMKGYKIKATVAAGGEIGESGKTDKFDLDSQESDTINDLWDSDFYDDLGVDMTLLLELYEYHAWKSDTRKSNGITVNFRTLANFYDDNTPLFGGAIEYPGNDGWLYLPDKDNNNINLLKFRIHYIYG
mmetsp:Transcript_3242/g.2758  ORF Transcript_3242/g.2758 Transcript_3242/m.2758 type:complete len:166 (-) Transcript_3242:135-632(-)